MSVRSRRQVRRLRLVTPFRLRPPVHNAEVALRKRMRAAWRAADRTPWATVDLRPALAAMAEFSAAMVRVQQVFTQSAASMEALRGRLLRPVEEAPSESAFRATPSEFSVSDHVSYRGQVKEGWRRHYLGEWVRSEESEQTAVDPAEFVAAMGVPRRVVLGFDAAYDSGSVGAFEVAEDDR